MIYSKNMERELTGLKDLLNPFLESTKYKRSSTDFVLQTELLFNSLKYIWLRISNLNTVAAPHL